jgi:C4-dicarboxylate-binding protein DctP
MWMGKSMVLVGALCLLTSGASYAEEILLRVTLQQSITDAAGQNILDFKREVESRTKGAVKMELIEKAQSVSGRPMLQAVGGGSVEMSVVSLAEVSKDIPPAGVFTLPFLFNFDSIVQAAARPGSEIRNIIDAEIIKSGSRVLWWQPHGATVIFSKGAPITNPRGLSGHRVGVLDEVSAEFIRLCGGMPTVINAAQQIDAMETQTVDSIMAGIAAVQNYDILDKADTINNIRYSESLFVILIGEKTWQRLSPEQQNIVTDAARAAEVAIWQHFAETEAESYGLALQRGMKLETVTADDTLAWRACSSSILESFVSRTELIGARLLAAYGKLRSDPCCNQALQSPTGD